MLFGSNKLIGLDIGVSSIKLVEVDSSKTSVTLTAFGFVPTPAGSIVGGEITQPEALAQAVAQLLQQTQTKRKKACVSMWGTGVITKKISIPRIDENLLGEQLRWEAEQYLPFDIKEINLNYQYLKKNSPNPEQMSILLVAAKRDFVLRYAEVVETSGLECKVIDVAGFALANTFEFNYPDEKRNPCILLNVGAGMTNFVVMENGEVTFSRDIPVGGNTYTADIQRALNISIEEAENLKISAGTGQAVPNEVRETISQTNEVIGEELRRSFDFFLATSTDSSIHKVFATGGGLGAPGLFEQIHTSLDLPVEHINPFQRVRFSKNFTSDYISQIAPYASVGIGLAMRRAKE